MNVTPLNLHRFIWVKDVRKIIWGKLTKLDVAMCKLAMNPNVEMRGYALHKHCAREGHLELLKYLCDVKPIGNWLMERIEMQAASISGGHVEIFEWLAVDTSADYKKSPHYTRLASRCGQLRMLKYLFEGGWGINPDAADAAAQGGHLEVLRYLHSIEVHCRPSVFWVAAKNGHLDIIKWGMDTNLTVTPEEVFMEACIAGHEHVMQWVKDQGWMHLFAERICVVMSVKRSPEVMQRALKFGCRWSDRCVEQATRGGNFALVKWLIESGCPWNRDVCLGVLDPEDREMWQWLHEHM